MKLQQVIFDETLKWVKESGFTTTEYNDELYIGLDDLARCFGGSTKASFKNKLKNIPGYGEPKQELIFIKYLPYFLAQYTPRNIQIQDKIHETLKRLGFVIPDYPPPKLYFIEFRDKENGEKYCKMGWTSTSIETRLNSICQQIGKLADGKFEKIAVIETPKALCLEKQLKKILAPDRVTKFSTGATVGKEEIYRLTPKLYNLIMTLKVEHCLRPSLPHL